MRSRFGDSIVRNDNIIIKEQREASITSVQETTFLTNSATGQRWQFQHVNLGVGTGDGTFENPTGTIAQALNVAQANDIVYVQAGTNPGVPGFTIPSSVQVLSSGGVQQISTAEIGTIQLPLSSSGTLPTVTGTVTIGNNSTLSGFTISSDANPGISASNVGNFTIRNNTITSTTSQGVLLENVTGQIAIADNTIQNSGIDGLFISNNQGQVDLNLTGNTIRNNGITSSNGNGVNIELSNAATGTFNFTNNTIADNISTTGVANGINVQLFDSANPTLNFSRNTIINNAGQGINIALEANANGTFNLTENNLTNNRLSGLSVLMSNSSQGNFGIANNTITNNQVQGLDLLLADTASGTFNISNNTITDNQAIGINLLLSNIAQGNVNITNNTAISRNGLYGIFANVSDDSQLRLIVDSNPINNSSNSFAINSFNTADIFVAVRSNNITGATSDFEAVTFDTGNICLQTRSNQIGNFFINDLFRGLIQIEEGIGSNNIPPGNVSVQGTTTVPAGTCGF